MLLHDLTIENFRSFEKYKLDKLARVNLLVGDNNCGKTSVLEAVRLLVARDKIGTILNILELREDFDRVEVGTGSMGELQIQFNGASLFRGGMFAEDFRDFETVELAAVAAEPLELLIDIQTRQNSLSAELVTKSNPGSNDERHESITMLPDGMLIRPWDQWPIERVPSTQAARGAYFLSAFHRSTQWLAAMWESVIKDKREQYVIESLQVIDKAYQGVVFSPRTETLRDIHVDVGLERVSMSVLGNGIELMLRTGIALANSRSGTLLIDEIDTGLHYSRLADMWKMVITAAKNLDVQVFATTHSLDCIRGLAEAVRNDDSFTDEVAVFRIDRRTTDAIRFDGEELEVIVDQEIEVRG